MTCEYTVYDSKKGDMRLVKAGGWREAVIRGYKVHSILPRRGLDVRPRTGDCSTVLNNEVFEEFISKHF